MNKRSRIVAGVVSATFVILIAGPLLVPLVRPWSRINCTHEEIDLQTGRKRVSRYLWYIRVSRRIEETFLCEIIAPSSTSVTPDWRSVNTFTPWQKHSPHYAFHGALTQVGNLQIILHIYDVPQEQRIEAAKGLLAAWQEADGDDEATIFLQELDAKFARPAASTQ